MTFASTSLSSASRAMRETIIPTPDTPILFDCVRARGPEGIQFDVWYCNAHLPALASDHRVDRLRRYAAPSRASYIAIGELATISESEHAGSATSDAPAMVDHMERFIGQPLGAQRRRDAGDDVLDSAVVYPAFLRVPHDRTEELNRWYDEEHLPILLSCPQWVMTRRFRITAAHGLDWNHVALHYMADLRALQSSARDLARGTSWRDKLLAEGWFAPEYRVCYRLQDF